MKDALLALTLLTSSITTAAAGEADLKAPKEVQVIHRMVGTWTAKNAQLTMGGKTRKTDVTMVCASTAGGHGVLCNSKLIVEGLGVIEETDLFGYDAESDRYHWYAVTTRGEAHDHVAMPPTAKNPSLVFAHSGFQTALPMQEVLRLTFNADATKIEFRNDGLVGGKQEWTAVATLTKK